MAMSDAEIRFSTAIDPSGFQDGIGDANATLGKMQQAVSGVAKATQEAFGPSAQTKINKLGEQLKNAQAQYERLMSGEVQPRSLQVMERQLNSNQKEASKLEAQMGSLQAALSSGFALPGQAEQLEILKSRLSEIDGEGESLIHKMNQIQLNPESSAEAEKLRNKIERISAEMSLAAQRTPEAFDAQHVREMNSAVADTAAQVEHVGSEAANTAARVEQAFDEKPVREFNAEVRKTPKRAHAASGAIDKFASRIKNLVIAAFVFNIIRRGLSQLRDYMGGLLSTNAEFVSSLNAIKVNLATAFQPIFEAILPALNSLMSALANATAYIAQFISMLFGKSYNESKDAAKNLNKEAEAIKNVGGAAKSAGKSLASFDEINQQAAESSGGGGSADAGFSDKFDAVASPEFDMSWWDGISKALQPTIDAFWGLWEAVKPFAGMIGEGLAWFYENVLVPLAGWVFSALIPKLFEVLEKFFIAIAPIVRAVGNGLIRLWDSFLKPLAKWTGQLVVNLLSFLCDVLVAIGQWAEEYSGAIEFAAIVIGGFFTAFLILKGITGIVSTVKTALKTFGTALDAFMKSNIVTLVISLIAGIGIAIYTAVQEAEQSKIDQVYGRIFGDLYVTVEEWMEELGSFSSNTSLALSGITDRLKPEAEQWRQEFVKSSEAFNALVTEFGIGGGQITETTLPLLTESLGTMTDNLHSQLDAEKTYQLTYWTELFQQNDGVIDEGEREILRTIVERTGDKHTEVESLEAEITGIYATALSERRELTDDELLKVNELMAQYNKLANIELERSNAEQELLLDDIARGRIKITEDSYQNYIDAVVAGEKTATELAQANRVEGLRLARLGLEEGTEEYANAIAVVQDRYDKEVAEIGTKSQNALKAMSDQFKDSVVDSVGSVEDLESEFETLTGSIEDLTKRLGDLGAEMENIDASTEAGLEAYRKMEKAQDDVGRKLTASQERFRELQVEMLDYQRNVGRTFDASKKVLDGFVAAQDGVAERFAASGKYAGVSYAEGWTMGFTDSSGEALSTSDALYSALINNTYKKLDIHSPSGVTQDIGKQMNAGLELGITQTSGGVVAAFTAMFNTILSHLQTFANHFLRGWRDMILQSAELARVVPDAPRITVPGFNPIAIPRLATGGLINAPTVAMIGERGREAVLPLDRNTGWMDDLADRLADRIGAAVGGSGGGDTIILEIDRRELGRVVVPAYDGEKRRMGVRIQPRGTLS